MGTPTIPTLLPDADALLVLEPEELAGPLLYYLSSLPERDRHLHRDQFIDQEDLAKYPEQFRDQIGRALIEAWVWLEREGLIARKDRHDWIFVTRRGRKVAKPGDFDAYKRANLLPRQLLHPRIAQKVWATFLRGDYEVAVLQAFIEVEVRVREAGGFSRDEFGVELMRKAFDQGKGPLRDPSDPKPEREALAHLFAGAFGSYRNPLSHRHVDIEPTDAVELIVFASHLLHVVDRREALLRRRNEAAAVT